MSTLPNIVSSADGTEYTNRRDSKLNEPSSESRVHKGSTSSRLRSTPDRNPALTLPATRAASHQPSDGSETAVLSPLYDGGTFDDASTLTLEDKVLRHEVGVDKDTQNIPTTIVPVLLQGSSDLSSSQSSSDGEGGGSCETDEDSSDSGDGEQGCSAARKDKWKAQPNGDATRGRVRSSGPQFHFQSSHNTVEDWVIHTRPILQDYADRQISLPLNRRLEVSIDEPPQFILGAIQLLVNRDQRGCTDRSRKLGPQLIENFVDIERWMQEYFRSHHATRVVDSDVPALLTIIMNNFYEGQIQLIDRLVEFALENMSFCGRTSLGVEDFAFGFDFRMSQDMPFYVETSSRIREPLPVHAVDVQPTSEPLTTNSGRQVKPTERARAATEQAQEKAGVKRDKEKNTAQVKDKQPSDSDPPACQKKKSTHPSLQCTEAPTSPQAESHAAPPPPPKTVFRLTKHHPLQPSNLRLPPILPGLFPAGGTTSSRLDDSPKVESGPTAATESPKVSGLGSNLTVKSPLRLKITLPPPGLHTSLGPAIHSSESSMTKTNGPTSQTSPPTSISEATNGGRGPTRSGVIRPRGPRDACDRDRGRERGSVPLTPSADTPDAARSDNTLVPPPANLVDAGISATVKAPVARPTLGDGVKSTVGMATRIRSRRAESRIDNRDDRHSTSQNARNGQSLLPHADPSHPGRKKRKLDDCED